MEKKKAKKKIHYGRELKKAMKRNGAKKEFIAEELLKISRPTLNTRLKSGLFTDRELAIVKEYIK